MYLHYPNNRAWSFLVQRLIDESTQGAADFNECQRTLQRIGDGDREAWYAEWTRTAEYVEGLAREAANNDHPITARDCFLRAFTYYRTAQFWLDHHDPRKTPAFLQALACFQKAGSFAPTFFEKVEIPFEATTLPGYFCHAEGHMGEKRPVIVFIGGADTFAEQLIFMGVRRITERGISCLTLTGPGQGELLRVKQIYARPDYERPLAAAFDLLEKRKDVDARKMAVMGVSLGGYYAARGASLERRAAACVLFGACYSVLDDIYDYYPPLQPALQSIVGAKGPDEARAVLANFTLEGILPRMQCPLLINHGAEDFIVSPAAAHRTYAEARCPKQLRIWQSEEGGAGHCMVDNRAQAFAFMFDWLSDQLN